MYIPVPSYGELSLGPAKEDSQLVSSMALLGGHRLSRARLFMCVCGSGLCPSVYMPVEARSRHEDVVLHGCPQYFLRQGLSICILLLRIG